jgi:hypothetical protein
MGRGSPSGVGIGNGPGWHAIFGPDSLAAKNSHGAGCGDRAVPRTRLTIGKEELAARIQALVESDRLEGNGDLRMWRFSEVRLKV